MNELTDEEIVKTFYPMGSCSENEAGIARAIGRAIIRKDRAQRQAGQEPVLYQFRWLNPGNNPNIGKNETAWLPVEPRNVHTDTVENRVRELRAYRYGGKPVYEVRPLYTAPQPAQDHIGDAAGKVAPPAAQVPEASTTQLMADEYAAWIAFHHAGNGDFSDFLKTVVHPE